MRKVLVIFLLLKCLDLSVPFCVFDNKKGWWLDCGIRDSYLFRIKDLGGIQANFDVGIGFGDEKGFPNSISKTNHKGKGGSKYLPPPPTYLPGYASPNSGYKRKDGGIQNRRNDFPYKYESPSPSSPTFENDNQIAGTQQLYNQQPSYYRQSSDKPIPKQEIQYIHHERGSQNQKYNKPYYAQNQNQYNQYYNQIASQDLKQQKPIQSWNQQKPQAVVTRRSQTASQGSGYRNHASKYSFIPPTKKFQARTFEGNSMHYSPSGLLIPPPPQPPRQPPYYNHHNRQDNGFSNPHFQRPFVFRVPTTTTPPPPTVGPALSELLNVPSHVSANSDNVPSFAAKMFVIREAPYEFYPPHYDGGYNPNRPKINVQIPRTTFYCEEQKYLPGIYADSLLGCKVFHLCVPSSVGSTLTSYMCPNSTLFDQSILQCNYWYNVDCESSMNDYDANLALALSYRRINAAHMPLHAATHTATLSLLSQNIDHLQVSNPKSSLAKRVGRMLSVNDVDLSSQTSSKSSDDKSTQTSSKSSDDKLMSIEKDPKISLFKYENKVHINDSIENTFNKDPSNTLSTSSKVSPNPNSSSKDKLKIPNYSLKNLVVQIQNQFKTKKLNELNKKLGFSSLHSSNLNKHQNSSSWTPLYKDEYKRFRSVDLNTLHI